MAQNVIAGPGQGLNPPQNLYPSSLQVTAPIPYTPGTNIVSLAAGQALPVPAGDWAIQVGPYSLLQILDPVTGLWSGSASALDKIEFVSSDGFTRRVANLTGCPVAAVVTTQGTTYTQATTTVTASAGGSTWQAIVGGLVTLTTISVAGAGYTLPPIAILPAGPAPVNGVPQSVPATAVAGIASGTVSTITVTNQGAGYPTGFTVTLLPDPTDPNIASITNAVAVFGVTGGGSVAAIVCTNNGAPTATVPSLTISGGDGTARATAVWMNTILSSTITAAGSGYPNGAPALSAGGTTAAVPAHTNPAIELTAYIPRPAQATVASNGTTITSLTLVDSGLFTGTPVVTPIGGVVATVASITVGLGGKPDTVIMQPL